MGFRCPFCKADFGHDKAEFERLCPPKVLLADKNGQNWLKTAFNPQTP